MRIAAIFLLVSLLIGCSEKKPDRPQEKTSIFHGHILNNSTNEVRLESLDTAYFGEVDSEGKFCMVLQLKEAGFYKYTGNEFTYIFLAPDETLKLDVDASDWRSFDKSLSFSETIGAYNNYLFRKNIKIDDLFNSQSLSHFRRNPDDYLIVVDSIANILKTDLSRLITTNSLPNDIIDAEKSAIKYFKLGALCAYAAKRN